MTSIMSIFAGLLKAALKSRDEFDGLASDVREVRVAFREQLGMSPLPETKQLEEKPSKGK